MGCSPEAKPNQAQSDNFVAKNESVQDSAGDEIGEIRKLINSMKQSLDERFDKMDEGFKAFQKETKQQLDETDTNIRNLRKDFFNIDDRFAEVKSDMRRNTGVFIGIRPSIFESPQSRRNSISKPDIDMYPIDSYKK